MTKTSETNLNIKIEGTDVELVNSFTYLGQTISDDGRSEKEIKRRIEIARTVFNCMTNVLTSKNISLHTRKRIVKCYIWTTLLYGCETWTLVPACVKKLQAFEMWVYRKLLKISWTQKLTNAEIRNRIQEKEYIMPTIRQRKLAYLGHIVRRDNLHRQLMEGKINGKRGRGRPRQKWIDDKKKWINIEGYDEIVRRAQDQERWRIMAEGDQDKSG